MATLDTDTDSDTGIEIGDRVADGTRARHERTAGRVVEVDSDNEHGPIGVVFDADLWSMDLHSPTRVDEHGGQKEYVQSLVEAGYHPESAYHFDVDDIVHVDARGREVGE